ncbi:MAG: cytochrome c peroxidase [Pseudomonadota bacterium]
MLSKKSTLLFFFYIFILLLFVTEIFANNGSLLADGSLQADGSLLKNEPIKPIINDLKLNKEKVLLGERLFFDKRLSANNTISCASCHDLELAGTDAQQFATGIYKLKGNVNTPTIFNSRYNVAQFWDGRADNLAHQAFFPVENPVEMGSQWSDVIVKLSLDKAFLADFKVVYNEPISAELIVDAIAEYETSLITINSPFDRYLLGDQQAISEQAKRGYSIFKSYGCISCHQGINIGGNMFHKLGVMISYYSSEDEQLLKRDLGRFNVTDNLLDKHVFKVPSLRLVTQTAPYFHDGSIKLLEDAIKTMAKYQLLREISDTDIALIIEFLSTQVGQYQRLQP